MQKKEYQKQTRHCREKDLADSETRRPTPANDVADIPEASHANAGASGKNTAYTAKTPLMSFPKTPSFVSTRTTRPSSVMSMLPRNLMASSLAGTLKR